MLLALDLKKNTTICKHPVSQVQSKKLLLPSNTTYNDPVPSTTKTPNTKQPFRLTENLKLYN